MSVENIPHESTFHLLAYLKDWRGIWDHGAWCIHDITVLDEVRSAAVNKPLGVEFNVIKVGSILFSSYD